MDCSVFIFYTVVVYLILVILYYVKNGICKISMLLGFITILNLAKKELLRTEKFVGNGNSWDYEPYPIKKNEDKRNVKKIAVASTPILRDIGEEHIVNDGSGNGYESKILKKEVIKHNKKILESVLYPPVISADDRIFEKSKISALKPKKSINIRSHWNNNNWKRFYDYELNIHDSENRDWWTDDDQQLARKHVVI